ncbi:TetR/AcrR family transcriptional regulator C-terminal domain-containing protein [Salmonella enterica subsp. enterica]|nr:TetR/AcrR family transcriptional regulator C-terminal domain-containing protein [Salmonella enterica subsp. enterica]
MEAAACAASLPLRAGFRRDAVNALMTISYFTVGACLARQAGDSDTASAAAPLSRLSALAALLRRRDRRAFDEAGPDAAFEQTRGIVDMDWRKGGSLSRNVEGPG